MYDLAVVHMALGPSVFLPSKVLACTSPRLPSDLVPQADRC
jgi:hypothetical protein